jgi:NAD(P)-dependent dehydrogenase (short-subunit alcohol dehydrogenase family)
VTLAMSRVFVTGSSSGLGLMTGQLLLDQGHAVTLHARSESRAEELRGVEGRPEGVLVGDLSTLAACASWLIRRTRAAVSTR